MKSIKILLSSLMLITCFCYAKKYKQKAPSIQYPITTKIEHSDSYFGVEINDPYQWLENDTASATEKWVDAQNKVTFNYLAQIPYREQLKNRFKELYNYSKIGTPILIGNYIFYSQKDGLQNQSVIYYQDGINGKSEIFIDPNQIDPSGLTNIEISGYSNNNKYITVNVNKAGSDWATIHVYDIATKIKLNDELQWVKFSGSNWYQNGFFYSRYAKPNDGSELSGKNQYHSVYYHKIGDSQENDILVYKDVNEPLSYNTISVSDDEQYQFLYRSLGTYGNEIYWRKSGDITSEFQSLFTGNKFEYEIIDVINNTFLVLTNEGADNRMLVAVNPNQPSKEKWKIVIPESKEALLETVSSSNGKLFTKYLQNATNRLYSYNLEGTNKKEITLPGTGDINLSSGKGNNCIGYTYTSFNYPTSIFIHNTLTNYSQLFLKPKLPFNPEDYEAKQVWYKSHDGTKVSMFIVHKKGLVLNGKNPTYLYGYGGFSINMTPTFSSSRILLLENGGVFAMPNLRGGAEYGEEWHQQGMLKNKQNVFDDFIAAAEYLIKNKYTSNKHLAISGGSNGGLLVGACMIQRPDLFKVCFPAVGVMDMLKFHKFTVGWGWVPEYGSSEQSKEMFNYLKGYSPYHNIKENINYPATLITTADHDDRVVPAHSFKFAARLQELSLKQNPTLIRIEKNAGHGKGIPTAKLIDEVADQWSFFFWNVGVKSLLNNSKKK